MTESFRTYPLTLKRQLFLLFHFTLGLRIFYPGILLYLIQTSGQTELLKSGWADFSLSALMLVSTLFLVWPLIRESFNAFLKHPFVHLGTIALYLPMMLLASVAVNSLAAFFSTQDQSTNQSAIVTYFTEIPWLILFQALVYAPIVEEITYRGLFYRIIGRHSRMTALILSSALFGLAHVSDALLSGNFADLWYLPTYILLGYFLAKAYERSKSLFTPMTLHFLNNLVGLWSIYQTIAK